MDRRLGPRDERGEQTDPDADNEKPLVMVGGLF